MGLIGKMRAAFRARDETGKYFTLTDPGEWKTGGLAFDGAMTTSMKVSAVNAAVEIRSDSVGKLPVFVMDKRTKGHVEGHYLTRLLADRPNEAMTPFVMKKLLEVWRLQRGNAYLLPIRDGASGKPRELVPVHPDCITPVLDDNGALWYAWINPATGQYRNKLRSWDVVHLKGYSEDGITGISVLSRAAQTIRTAAEQQRHEGKFYSQSARPSGILMAEAVINAEAKAEIRKQWDSLYAGADNAFRTAVLDQGLKYQQLSLSQRDAQFIESRKVGVEDIARFYGVPLYKLQSGKQSYSSNEQNAIEYVVSALHPTVQQIEEEYSYKLLFESELRRGLEVRVNMNAELRGDMAARGAWYRMMREIGAFSVDDILALEDQPPVPGGDIRYASLNYVPLDEFRRLSVARNAKGSDEDADQRSREDGA